jgi:hypothetical protein
MKRGGIGKHGVWLAGTAVLLVVAAQAGAAAPERVATGAFSPPLSNLLLTRRLERPLADGNVIVTERTYEVQMFREGDGFRVEGRLIEARVEAPPSLAALAEIERRRSDAGLFPVRLDARGLIVTGSPPRADGSLDRASAVASAKVGSSLEGDERRTAEAFIAQLRGRPAHVQWPADVFHPAIGRRHEERSIAVPGGAEGLVTIEIEGRSGGTDGLIAGIERVVTTHLGADRRVTREVWRLVRAPASLHR